MSRVRLAAVSSPVLFAALALFCFLGKTLVRHQDIMVGPWDMIARKGPKFAESSRGWCVCLCRCILGCGAVLLLGLLIVCGMWFCTGTPGICSSHKSTRWGAVCVHWGIYPCFKVPALDVGPVDWGFFENLVSLHVIWHTLGLVAAVFVVVLEMCALVCCSRLHFLINLNWLERFKIASWIWDTSRN